MQKLSYRDISWTRRMWSKRQRLNTVERCLRLEKLEYRLVLSGLPYLTTDRPDESATETSAVQALVGDSTVSNVTEPADIQETRDASLCFPVRTDGADQPDGEFTGEQAVGDSSVVDQFFSSVDDNVSSMSAQTPSQTPSQTPFESPSSDMASAGIALGEPAVCSAVYQVSDEQDFSDALSADQVVLSGQTTDVFGPIQLVPVRELQATEAEGEPGFGGKDKPPLVAPQIEGFVADSDGVYWSFHGVVVDDVSPEGLVVRFGGILNGETATVDAGGQFELLIELPAGTVGNATAQTTDADGLDSNVASTGVN